MELSNEVSQLTNVDYYSSRNRRENKVLLVLIKRTVYLST